MLAWLKARISHVLAVLGALFAVLAGVFLLTRKRPGRREALGALDEMTAAHARTVDAVIVERSGAERELSKLTLERDVRDAALEEQQTRTRLRDDPDAMVERYVDEAKKRHGSS